MPSRHAGSISLHGFIFSQLIAFLLRECLSCLRVESLACQNGPMRLQRTACPTMQIAPFVGFCLDTTCGIHRATAPDSLHTACVRLWIILDNRRPQWRWEQLDLSPTPYRAPQHRLEQRPRRCLRSLVGLRQNSSSNA